MYPPRKRGGLGGRGSRGKAGCTSRFRGVSWEWRRADGRNWHAQLWHNNKVRAPRRGCRCVECLGVGLRVYGSSLLRVACAAVAQKQVGCMRCGRQARMCSGSKAALPLLSSAQGLLRL